MFDPAGDGKSCHGSLPISVKLEPAVSLHLSKKAYPSFAGMAAIHPIPCTAPRFTNKPMSHYAIRG